MPLSKAVGAIAAEAAAAAEDGIADRFQHAAASGLEKMMQRARSSPESESERIRLQLNISELCKTQKSQRPAQKG